MTLIKYIMINSLPADLVLEILYKLKYDSLSICLTNALLIDIFSVNEKRISKAIINSFNFIFFGIDNLKLLNINNKIIGKPFNLHVTSDNDIKNIKFIIENIATGYNSGNPSFSFVIKNKHISIINMALEIGEYLSEHTLLKAAGAGRFDLIKLLVKKGVNPRVYNDQALISAVMTNHFDIVKFLIEKGADPNVLHYFAFGIAKINGYTEIVEYIESQVSWISM